MTNHLQLKKENRNQYPLPLHQLLMTQQRKTTRRKEIQCQKLIVLTLDLLVHH